jgi:hypothetical protein
MNSFYINRLKTFSIAEFPYRIKQALENQLEEKVYKRNFLFSIDLKSTKKILDPHIVKSKTDQHLINIFGKSFNYENIEPADWHTDFFSGNSFPMSFSKKIDIRKNPALSAKVVWEVNRLQFLMEIALDYQNTKDTTSLNHFIRLIKLWKHSNPYLVGVNWYSNIEVNLRLITWFLCWEALDVEILIKENDGFMNFVTNDWLPLIYQHCIYSYKNPSKYSSANNHLISEYAGLFISASKWQFKESDKWIKYSKKGLEEEIINQHSKNGINKEQAAEYIQFITDFFLLAYIVGENTGRSFSKEYRQQLHEIFNYIYNFLDCAGNFPKYGDEDDGKCFIIDSDKSFNNFKSLLSSAAIIFNDSKFKSKSNGLDMKNLFLFGEKGIRTFQLPADVNVEESSQFYPDEGHFIFREKKNNEEIYLHFDAAPLGFLSIAAHGHADALSFVLHINGQPFLVDSGTYTYHTERPWRNYFMGTLAHNTIRINKQNQALIGGPTLWLKHYKVKILKSETNQNYDYVKAEHIGYKRLGIIHSREIFFEKKNKIFKITDTIKCKKKKSYFIELPFHLHPFITIDQYLKNENQFILSDKTGRKTNLEIDSKLQIRIVRGQIEPDVLGWYSESFMCKQPTSTILCSLETTGNTILETKISIN